MGVVEADPVRQEYAPEVRRAAARVVVTARVMNGREPEQWALERADYSEDEMPKPPRRYWWSRFRRRGTAI